MMGAVRKMSPAKLIDRLPAVQGRYEENAALAKYTWFRVGGPAEVLFRPADVEDLRRFLAGTPADVPLTVIGVSSNLLVRDGGVGGVVLRLGRQFAEIQELGDGRMRAGAAAMDANLARRAQAAGVAGLEFFAGIPGTVGGALRMNAGAYGTETRDVLVRARAVDRTGALHEKTPAEMNMTYRSTGVPADWIFVDAEFQGRPGDGKAIQARMNEITAARGDTQPVKSRTGGSTFKNPQGHKAWELIDRAGCRGLVRGGAQVSELHCNFLINTGDATAADLEELGEEVRRRVRDHSGIELEWEIRRIGVPLAESGS